MKALEVRLQEALDKVATRNEDAAKQIAESKGSAEEKLAICERLLGISESIPRYRQPKLEIELRESCDEFRPRVRKYNGVLDNHGTGMRESAKLDSDKQLLIEAAKKTFGVGEAGARIMAGIDDDLLTEQEMQERAKLDSGKQQLIEAAKKTFRLSEKEAKVFAGIDDNFQEEN